MAELDAYELKNIDPEDISDVLLKIEKSFDFKFAETELKDVKTFGELCGIVVNKVKGDISNDCTTQQAFYKIRDAITNTLSTDKNSITPRTDLQQLFPGHERRKQITEMENLLGFKAKILRPKYWLTGVLAITTIASFIGLFIFWKVALVLLIISIAGLKLSDHLGNELDVKTLGQLTEKITREHYKRVRRNNKMVNRNEIALKVKEIFKQDLYLEDTALTRDATFD